MTLEEYVKICESSTNQLSAQFHLSFLIDLLLGENWYSIYWNHNDINCEAVLDIAKRYKKKEFRKCLKARRKK